MKRSTALNIYRTAKPMAWRGTIEPMAEHDRFANEETRRRHGEYYRSEVR